MSDDSVRSVALSHLNDALLLLLPCCCSFCDWPGIALLAHYPLPNVPVPKPIFLCVNHLQQASAALVSADVA